MQHYDSSLPKVKVVESGKTGEYELELCDDPDDVLTLSVEKVPIFITFAKVGNFLVVDPCIEEEMCNGCRVSTGVNREGNVCATDKGIGPLSLESLPEITLAATKIGSKLISEIDALIELEKHGRTVKSGFSKSF